VTADDIDDPDLIGLRGTTRYGPEWRTLGKRLNDAGRAYDAGDIPGAEAILDEVRDAATGTADEALDIRARAVANHTLMAHARGDLEAAQRLTDEGIALCLEAERVTGNRFGISDARTNLLVNKAQTLQSLGRNTEALLVLDEAAAAGVAAELNAGVLPFLLHNTRAATLVTLGRFAEAETESRRALDVALATDPRLAAEAYVNLAAIAAQTGDEHGAAENMAVARDLHELAGSATDRADDELRLGRLAAAAGRYAEAEERIAVAQATYERAGKVVDVAEATMSRAMIAMWQHRFTEAVTLVDDTLAVLTRAGAIRPLIECHLVHAQITYVTTGNLGDTDEAFLRGRGLAVAAGDWHQVVRIDYCRAQLFVDAAQLTDEATRAELYQRAAQVAVMSALAADGLRHRYAAGPIRERWARFVAGPARALALRVTAELGMGDVLFLLVEYFSSGVTLAAATPDEHDLQGFPAPDLDDRLALPPRLELLPGGETILDQLVAMTEQEYHVPLRSAEVVRAW
jgi:tetratricopeptide (TPR) repeat protein